MMKPTNEEIVESLEVAAECSRKAEAAIAKRDRISADDLLVRAIKATCDSLSLLCLADSPMQHIANIAPNVAHYARALALVDKGDFDGALRLEPAPETFRASYGEVMNKDERYTWAAAFANYFAGGATGAVSARQADLTIIALRDEMAHRGGK
jgi:hypothetical protein